MWNCCASGAIFSLTRMQLTIFKKSFFLMVLFGHCGTIGLFSVGLHIIIQASTTLCYPCQVQVQVFHKPCCPWPNAFLKEWTWADTWFTICISANPSMQFSSSRSGPGLVAGIFFSFLCGLVFVLCDCVYIFCYCLFVFASRCSSQAQGVDLGWCQLLNLKQP